MYSQSSSCTNMNQIHSTDYVLGNSVNKSLMNVAYLPSELSFYNVCCNADTRDYIMKSKVVNGF